MVARTTVVGLFSVVLLAAGCGKWLGAVFGGGDPPRPPPDPGPPTLATSVAELRFAALQGGAAPEAQVVEIANDGGGALAWTASTGGASWLQLSATSGTAPSSLSVAAAVSGLAPGVHTATITLSAEGASNTPVSVPVTLVVVREVAFAALETHLVGSGRHAVASADFNGDGRPDLAVTAETSGTVSILLGREIGGLGEAWQVGVGVGPTALTVADFDGDAWLDLAVANGGGDSLTVLLGAGDGTFGVSQTLAVGSLPISIAHGDFDGDGDQDLALANAGDYSAAGTVSVLLGAGDGTFGAPTAYGAGFGPIAVVAGDFDGDATLDLAVADYDFSYASTENLRLLKGDGAGGFAPLETRALPSRLWVMEGADLDGDGTTDLVAGSASFGEVTVLMGTPGGLGEPTQYATPTFGLGAIEVGDFDGDGIQDLAVTDNCLCDDSSYLLPGLGAGAFGTARAVLTGGSSLCAGDFDQDGNLDLAAADWDRSATVAHGKGDGSFLTARSLGAGLHGPRAVATGDFDGDGAPDVAAIDESAGFDATIGNLSLWHGDGAGAFGARETFAVTSPLSLAAFDLYQRNVSDVVVAGMGTVSILPGSTTGGLGPATNYVIAGSGNAVAVGFLDSEGYPDLVVSTWTYPTAPSGVDVLVGSGSGFLPATHVPAAYEPHAVALGDLNGDSVSDLVVANRSGGFAVLIGTGGGAFGAPTETYAQVTRYLELADFDGDGKLDLVNADYDTSEVRLGNGDGTFGASTAFPVGGASGVVADFNGDGQKDVALTDAMGSRVRFLLGVGDGRFFLSSRSYAAAFPIDYFQGSEVADVAVADFDGDGRADLAYSNGKDSYGGSVSVLMRR